MNLIPIMNLMMVLIPFLLMGAAFYHLGAIPSSLPQHSPHDSDVPKTPTTVSVNLEIDAKGLSVSVSSVSLAPEDLDAMGFTLPKKGDAYDTDGLHKRLLALKKQYPSSTTAIILAAPKVRYDELVTVLDAIRDHHVPQPGKDDRIEELFPVTVFSQKITAPEEPAAP